MSEPKGSSNFFKDMLDDGHLSKRGGKRVRARLYEAAILVPTRIGSESALRWGLKLKDRAGFKCAAVAVARKLGVIMPAICMRCGGMARPSTR
jgi:hypothetical protein